MGVLAFVWRDVVIAVCGSKLLINYFIVFLLMGMMICSARSKKRPSGWPKYQPGDTFRVKGNLAASTIMWCLLLILAVVLIVLRKQTVLK